MRQKLVRTFLSLQPDIESIYFDNFAVFPRSMQPDLLSPETRARTGADGSLCGRAARLLEETDAKSLLDRLLYADIKTYLHELLMKQDQMSMAASIESRVPFLDHKLVEFTADLRRACETQIKSHLVHLREGFIETGGTPRAVTELVTASAPAFGALLRNIARLNGSDARDRAAATRDGARLAQVPDAVVTDILSLERPSAVSTTDAAKLFPEYLGRRRTARALHRRLGRLTTMNTKTVLTTKVTKNTKVFCTLFTS